MTVAKGSFTGSFLLGLFPLKQIAPPHQYFFLLDKPVKMPGRKSSKCLNFLNFFLLGNVLMMNIKL